MTRVALRTCNLCEAGCGLELTRRDDRSTLVRGDRKDPSSHGYLCPKGTMIAMIDADPDRVVQPLVRRNGDFIEASWDDAFEEIAHRLPAIRTAHGHDAVATFTGNPAYHNLGATLYLPLFARSLGTRNRYSSGSLDSWPKQVSSLLLFGHPSSVPVPDLDRARYLLVLGANPMISNGSQATAADWPGRLDRIIERGGRIVVVDPRRTETARRASEHVFIRPGADALFLLAIIHSILALGPPELGRCTGHVRNLAELARFVAPFDADAVAGACGISGATIRRISGELIAHRGVTYGRLGTCVQEHGAVASWAVDVVNILSGGFDAPGGAMFPRPATGVPALGWQGAPLRLGRFSSTVHEYPEVLGELPAVTMCDEILVSGDERIRALITHSGNPVRSIPDGRRVEQALRSLELMISLDIYINETTRFADVILPSRPLLARSFYPFALQHFAMRSFARYSPAVDEPPAGQPDDWEVLLQLMAIVRDGRVVDDVSALDDEVAAQLVAGHVRNSRSSIHGRDPAEILEQVADVRGPERLLDIHLRTGPFGDRFGEVPDGISLRTVQGHPHGLDLGPLVPALPEILATPDRLIDLLPPEIADNREALLDELAKPIPSMVLIGRRQLQSNNSWMHNVSRLVGGRNRCVAHVNTRDAAALGVRVGDYIEIATEQGSVAVACEPTDDLMPGVVSVPHGWRHDDPDVRLRVAARLAGSSINDVIPTDRTERVTKTAVLVAVPIEVRKLTHPRPTTTEEPP